MWEELLNEITIIKWGVVCLTFVCLCRFTCLLYNKIRDWRSLAQLRAKVKDKKPNTLEQRKKDLAAATRPRKTPWDG